MNYKTLLTSLSSMLMAFPLLASLPKCDDWKVPEITRSSQNRHGFSTRPQLDDRANPPLGPLLSNTFDVFVNAEFLYWYSNVSNTPFFLERLQGSQPQTRIELRTKNASWGWDPGLRLALGTVIGHDGWDVKGEWTYFYNSNTQSHSVPDTDSALSSTTLQKRLSYPLGTEPVSGNTFLSAKNYLHFNQGLLALGRKFHVSKYLDLKPSFGIRGIFTSYKIHANLGANAFNSNNPNVFTTQRSEVSNKQHYWGVGLGTALNTDWFFIPNTLKLSNQVGLGLLYGKANVTKFGYTNATRQTGVIRDNSNSYSHQSCQLIPVLDVNVGLGWNTYLKQKKYRLSFAANWENHFFYNFNQFDRFLNEVNFGRTQGLVAIASKGNLVLSGFTLSGNFEF